MPDELKPAPNEDWKKKVNLGEVIDQVTEDDFRERCEEVRKRVRQVLAGVDQARRQVSKCETDLKKAIETYEKGLNKLDQIRKGNWNLLEDKQAEKKEEVSA